LNLHLHHHTHERCDSEPLDKRPLLMGTFYDE
jgi:hypothetical protein